MKLESIQPTQRGLRGYIKLETPTEEITHIEISVKYTKGGVSFYDYKTYPSAYWLHVTPVKIEDGFVCSTMGQGTKYNLEESQRFNKVKLDLHWGKTVESIFKKDDSIVNKMIKSVSKVGESQ